MTLPVEIITVLLLIAVTVAIAVKRIRVPYSIALVIVGLIIGIFRILPPVRMTPELILIVFLPALLFEASFNINLKRLKLNWLPILVLSTLGVIFSLLVIAAVIHYFGGIHWQAALLFGAMVSATDPVSVIAIFKKFEFSRRLLMLLEGESLFNDGVAVVSFQLALSFVLTNSFFDWPMVAASFLLNIIGGISIGILVGFAAIKYSALFDDGFEDHVLLLMMTTVVAYGSFLIAMQLNVSPVLAVVSAGIVLSNFSKSLSSRSNRVAVDWFWEYAAFAVNSLIFLLIGMQIQIPLLQKYASVIGLGIVALLVSRAIVIYLLCPVVSNKTRPIPISWQHVLFWGALRGSLSMSLALSLPATIPLREELTVLTFGTVLFTLLVQGLTIEPAIRFLSKKDQRLLSTGS